MLGLLYRPGPSRGWLLGIALALLVAVGCKNTCSTCGSGRSASGWVAGGKCAQHEPGSIPAPVGTYTREAYRRQAEKAEADDFVFYNYEFNEEGSALGPAGCRHLIQVAHRVKHNEPFPVVIEATGDPKIDMTRRHLIVSRLGAAGITDAEQRVLVGLSQAEGLYGDEAPRIYNQMLQGNNFNNQGGYGGFGFANQGGFGIQGGFGGQGGYGGVGFVGGFGAFGR